MLNPKRPDSIESKRSRCQYVDNEVSIIECEDNTDAQYAVGVPLLLFDIILSHG